ncbi:12440_t:CDS:2 [Racocetra persica]|uniref:12440_t:CDS:1 n=1 Tax=Racocetra persica TaxID=160502 RepID=A0ACA9P902_9GLOM|nr:12440_t:CDS:2 [Racocetra persica]
MMESHMHLHSLIPNINGFYLSANDIWEQSTKQIYEFCVNHNLKLLWTYLWEHWYRKEIWNMWAQIYPFIFLPPKSKFIQQAQSSMQLMHSDAAQSLNADNTIEVTNSIDDNDTESMQIFKEYKAVLSDALKIVQEQENANNIQWARSVQGSFKGIQNLVTDIQSYQRRITNPRTWKDHNQHTMFLNS